MIFLYIGLKKALFKGLLVIAVAQYKFLRDKLKRNRDLGEKIFLNYGIIKFEFFSALFYTDPSKYLKKLQKLSQTKDLSELII